MGQRLNLEIMYNGKTLANAYYHWSGYTSSSIELTRIALNKLKSLENEDMPPLHKAILALEETGAGFNEYEYEQMKEDNIEIPKALKKDCEGRNEGILAISEKGMDETRSWEEARSTIDFYTKRINFDVFWGMDEVELEERAEYISKGITLNFDVFDMSYDDFFHFDKIYEDEAVYKTPDGEYFNPIY